MQLNMATDYAIRSLLYLTCIGRMAPASEVADQMCIPKQYLVTMSRKLKEAGLIDASSGVYGGYYLARSAEEITLLDIIRVTEGTTRINRCAQSKACCGLLDPADCPVCDVYEQLHQTVDELFAGVTLADLKKKLQLQRPSLFEQDMLRQQEV